VRAYDAGRNVCLSVLLPDFHSVMGASVDLDRQRCLTYNQSSMGRGYMSPVRLVLVAEVLAAILLIFIFEYSRIAKLSRYIAMSIWTETIPDVHYGSYPRNKLDVMRQRFRTGETMPVAVVFHGGAWKSGGRRDMRERVCRRYLQKGFLVINVDYRPGLDPAAEDAARALEWSFQNVKSWGGDARRIIVTGESAGAHLALLSAFQSHERVAAVINFYGITDLTKLIDETLVRDALPLQNRQAEAQRLSPISFVRQGICPVWSVHGLADDVVPPSQTALLTERIRNNGGTAEDLFINDGQHGFSNPGLEIAYRAAFEFLTRQGIL
jgi:acetyl esterase/lipase